MTIASTIARAATPLPSITASDLFYITYAMEPQISPDGGKAVYLKQWMDVRGDQYRSQLWMVDIATGRSRSLTTVDADAHGVRWSNDGTALAFFANPPSSRLNDKLSNAKSQNHQVHIFTLLDGKSRQIGELASSASRLAWSPDGARIAFVMKVHAQPPTIGAIATPPAGARWRPPPFITQRLRFRFDGAGTVGDDCYDVHILAVATGSTTRLSHCEAIFGGPLAVDGSLSWAPDGRTIIASAHTDRESQYTPRESDVYGVDAQSGAVHRLTDLPGGESQAQVSPDGHWLSFLRTERSEFNYRHPKLAVAPVGGGSIKILSEELDRPVSTLQWAADSTAVFANYEDRGISRLARFGVDGSVAQIADGLGSWALAYIWGATFSVARDGSFVMTTSDERTPGDVALGRVGIQGLRRITHLSDAFLSSRQRSDMSHFTLRSIDGVDLEGWMVKPPGFDAARRYPVILSIHGGPYMLFGPRWDYRHEVMAGAGYLVVYINPRGSTGYGEHFAQMTDKAFPGAEYPDFEAITYYLQKQPFVDRKRMYLNGGSAGGTLTAYIVGRSSAWRAAVSEWPVIDYPSWSLLADNPAVYTQYWSGGFPWTNSRNFALLSPITNVGSVSTPTMMVCGEEDARTPISQCDMFYTALKLRGVDTALVRYPGEAHEVEDYPSDRVSEINLLLGWFANHDGSDLK